MVLVFAPLSIGECPLGEVVAGVAEQQEDEHTAGDLVGQCVVVGQESVVLDHLHESSCNEDQIEREEDDRQRLPDEMELMLFDQEIKKALVTGADEELESTDVTGVRAHRHDPVGDATLMYGGEDAAAIAGHDQVAGLLVALRRKADPT